MKAKRLVLFLALSCALVLPMFFAQPADAQTYRLTLYFDWQRDGTFQSTSLTLDTSKLTFTTGDGAHGTFSMVGKCMALLYETGRLPIYSGPWYGHMDTRNTWPSLGPGYFYITSATATEDTEVFGEIKSDGMP